MKLILLNVFFLFISAFSSYAQKGLPPLGKIEKADLEMKDCEFDKGAEALTLISWGNMFYRRGKTLFNTVYEFRIRIKILKESGLSYANVSIPYLDENAEEQIQKISAYTYNLDASGNIKVTEVGKSSIYTKRLNKQYSAMIIAFPEAKVGSVVEYRYTLQRETMGYIKEWYFQKKIPTRYSECQVNIPSIFHFVVQPSVVDPMEIQEAVTEENFAVNEGTVIAKMLRKNYIMHNLRGIKDEPFMGSAKDYLQRLQFQLSEIDYGDGQLVNLQKDWSDVISTLMKDNDFGLQLEKRIPGSETIIADASRVYDPEDKTRLIYNYVRRNMNWDKDETIYAYSGVTNAWNKKTGSSADINLLLVTILRQAGLQANPILLSTRQNGLVNTFYPLLSQFNTVMAHVQVKDKFYVLDATDKVSNYKLTPMSVVNTQGFIVKGDKGQWIDVIDSDHKFKMMSAIQAQIDSSGVMKGTCLINSDGYAKKQRTEIWMKDKESFREEYFTNPYSTLKIDNLAVNNAELDSLPLEQKVQFTYVLNNSGDYRYFQINLFSGLEKNPFISDERVADIDFGYTQNYRVFGSYSLPEGYAFENLPENTSMEMPDNSIVFNRFLEAEDNLLNVRITLEFKRPFYSVASYPEFKEFYKKLFDRLNEQIVIKKKVAP